MKEFIRDRIFNDLERKLKVWSVWVIMLQDHNSTRKQVYQQVYEKVGNQIWVQIEKTHREVLFFNNEK